jgi:hypothetical protein
VWVGPKHTSNRVDRHTDVILLAQVPPDSRHIQVSLAFVVDVKSASGQDHVVRVG